MMKCYDMKIQPLISYIHTILTVLPLIPVLLTSILIYQINLNNILSNKFLNFEEH